MSMLNVTFGYVGGLGPESLPYFWALLGLVGSAFAAILQWPLMLMLRRRKMVKTEQKEEPVLPEQTNGDKS